MCDWLRRAVTIVVEVTRAVVVLAEAVRVEAILAASVALRLAAVVLLVVLLAGARVRSGRHPISWAAEEWRDGGAVVPHLRHPMG